MAVWRIGRGWTEKEIGREMERIASAEVNIEGDPDELIHRPGWHSYSSESIIATLEPGPPGQSPVFERSRMALSKFEFSDTGIVHARFNGDAPLIHRRMLLELKAFRMVHFLSGVVVGAVHEKCTDDATVFGYRYDTLEGHIERGAEWFMLTKEHDSGDLRFRISARWLPGDFPNWWSRIGFYMVGRHYQKKWHRRAHEIMADIVREVPRGSRPTERDQTKPDVIFERTKSHA